MLDFGCDDYIVTPASPAEIQQMFGAHVPPNTPPWEVLPVHPTQLYEMAFLMVFTLALWMFLRQPHRNGDVFKLFIAGYMGWRLLVDFLKPEFRVLDLSIIQWTCVIASIYYWHETARILATVQRRLRNEPEALA